MLDIETLWLETVSMHYTNREAAVADYCYSSNISCV